MKIKPVVDWIKKHVELAVICKENAPKPKFVISEVAKKHGVKILFLPVAHPELNPIELVWARLKDFIRKKMSTCP